MKAKELAEIFMQYPDAEVVYRDEYPCELDYRVEVNKNYLNDYVIHIELGDAIYDEDFYGDESQPEDN